LTGHGSWLILSAFFLASCATIATNGGNYKMTFDSTPSGALVRVNGELLGETPLTLNLKGKQDQILTFEKPGYRIYQTRMDTSINLWIWGNIVCCGVLGSTTDHFSGAMYEYSPNQYLISLTPEGGEVLKSGDQKLQDYVVLNWDALREQLSAGKGEQLDGLAAFAGKPSFTAPEVKQLLSMSKIYNPLEFVQGFDRNFAGSAKN